MLRGCSSSSRSQLGAPRNPGFGAIKGKTFWGICCSRVAARPIVTAALIPPRNRICSGLPEHPTVSLTHPLGCHRPRISDRSSSSTLSPRCWGQERPRRTAPSGEMALTTHASG